MLYERRAHKLKSNHTSTFPQRMIFFDVESRLEPQGGKFIHIPFLITACYTYRPTGAKKKPCDEWQTFTSTDDFWVWVAGKLKKKSALYMFALNITYDFVCVRGVEILQKWGFKPSQPYTKGRTFILTFRGDNQSVRLLDVGNFYQGSVASIGHAIGLPKLEVDVLTMSLEEAIPYCRRDVEIIQQAMLKYMSFLRDNDLGTFGITVPKQAFNAYRHRFMQDDIFIHDNQQAMRLERLAYYGGRTEAFYIGPVPETDVYYIDVNSMYPYVMRDNLYPVRITAVRENLSVRGLKLAMENRLAVAKVRVKTDVPCIPCRAGKKLIFPVGEFIAYLCTPELQLALEEGKILEVLEVTFYEGKPIFKEYVDFFYEQRIKAKALGDTINDLLYKLFLNSLYGKFGQKSQLWEELGPTTLQGSGMYEHYNMTGDKVTTYKYFGGMEWEIAEEKEGENSLVAIAAHVTSYARAHLWQGYKCAGRENVYYTDTDSFMSNYVGFMSMSDMIDKAELGKFKHEDTLHNLWLFGPKDYKHDKYAKHKGVPKKAKQLTGDTWQYTFWPRFQMLLNNNSLNQYWTRDMIKKLLRQYDKAWILQDGRTAPLEVEAFDGVNRVIPWEDSRYKKEGLQLAKPQQPEWVSKTYEIGT